MFGAQVPPVVNSRRYPKFGPGPQEGAAGSGEGDLFFPAEGASSGSHNTTWTLHAPYKP